jgi:hypothetical protein
MTDDDPLFELVSMETLRRMFDEAQLWLKAQRGDLDPRVEEDGHPSPPLSGDPICTRSQIVSYRDDSGREVALVHQYVRPDKSLGGTSGKPDPQEMLGEDGVMYFSGYYPNAEG